MRIRQNFFPFIIVLAVFAACPFVGGGVALYSYFLSVFAFFVGAGMLFFPFTKIETSSENVGKILSDFQIYFVFALCILVFIQLVNPSTEYVKISDGWSFLSRNYVRWLPSSVHSDGEKNSIQNLFYALLGGVVLFALLKCVLNSNRRIFLLLNFLFFSAIVVEMLFCLHKLTGANPLELISIDGAQSGTFYYHAHGNAFLVCVIGVGGTLMVSSRTMLLLWLYFVATVFLWFSVFLSGGAYGFFIASCVFGLTCIYLLFLKKKFRIILLGGVVLLVIVGTALFGNSALMAKVRGSYGRIADRVQNVSQFMHMRTEIKKMTFDMICSGGDYAVFSKKTSPNAMFVLFGRGLGSYRSMCEIYSVKNPNLLYVNENGVRFFMVSGHAHCDPLQFVFEFGIFGGLLILCWVVLYFVKIWKLWNGKLLSRRAVPLLVSLLGLFVFSINDNVFYNVSVSYCAILLGVCVLGFKPNLK